MPRTEGVRQIPIIPGALVLIADDERNWCASCSAFEDTGQNLYLIRLVSLCCIFTLPGLTPVQKCLYICFA